MSWLAEKLFPKEGGHYQPGFRRAFILVRDGAKMPEISLGLSCGASSPLFATWSRSSAIRQRAARRVLDRIFKGATVQDGLETGGSFYNVRREDTWLVYKNDPPVIKSSNVVVICKRTGRVLYEGSAADEG
jgi:hypothetical protein